MSLRPPRARRDPSRHSRQFTWLARCAIAWVGASLLSCAPAADEVVPESTDEASEATLIEDVEMGPKECARDSYAAQRVRVNLYLLMDISGSMRAAVGVGSQTNQWDAVRTALLEFIEAPASAGLDLALSYYPLVGPRSDCGGGQECPGGVACLQSVCDLRFVYADVVVPCEQHDECDLSVEVDGRKEPELCLQPGRCSSAAKSLCFVDAQCPAGGSCETTELGLCPGVTSCDSVSYEAPSVSRGSLPAHAPALAASLLGTEPDRFGITPTHVALEGAYTRVTQWLVDDPETQSVVVLATDGAPLGCTEGATQGAEAESAAAFATHDVIDVGYQQGIQTFVIGVEPDLTGVSEARLPTLQARLQNMQQQLGEMAQRGGTVHAHTVTADASVTASFLDALSAIRRQVLPCQYVIPEPQQGVLSYDRLNVELAAAGATQTVPKVNGAAECSVDGDAWYYDGATAEGNPTSVVLCPQTCQRANAALDNRVDIVLGCLTVTRQVR